MNTVEVLNTERTYKKEYNVINYKTYIKVNNEPAVIEIEITPQDDAHTDIKKAIHKEVKRIEVEGLQED